jgi:hypothetical protein
MRLIPKSFAASWMFPPVLFNTRCATPAPNSSRRLPVLDMPLNWLAPIKSSKSPRVRAIPTRASLLGWGSYPGPVPYAGLAQAWYFEGTHYDLIAPNTLRVTPVFGVFVQWPASSPTYAFGLLSR